MDRVVAAPAIVRLLEREPGLLPAVESVLERGVALRAAARRAYADAVPSGPPGDDAARSARAELEAAVAALEEVVERGELRGPTAQLDAATERGEPKERTAQLDAAIERLHRAVAAARAGRHAFTARRVFRSDEARRALSQAQWLFARAWAALEKEAAGRSLRSLPWRLELCSHLDPEAPFAELEISGHELPLTPAAKRPWGERCVLSGEPFLVDRTLDPVVRFRSLEAAQHVLSPACHDLVVRLRAALDRIAGDEAGSAALGALRRSFGFLFEEYLAEPCHPTFARLGLLDFPSLAVGLNNLLVAWGHRPLFGTLGRLQMPGGGPYAWRCYAEVRRDAFALARAWERLGVSAGARIGILVDENAPEFYLAELAAVLSGRASVGLPAGLSAEALAGSAGRAGLGLIVADRRGLELLRAPAFAAARGALAGIVAFGDALPELRPDERALAEWLHGGEGDEGEQRDQRDQSLASWRAPSGLSLETGILHDDAPGHARARALGIAADAADDLFTILFTSGSTGEPKGTLATRRRWAEEMCVEVDLWPYVGASFQPSAIAGDRGAVWRALANGGRVGFARRGAELFHDLRRLRPTLFDVPPVIWNTLYGEYRRAISRADLDVAEVAAIRRRFRDALGGRIAFMATGGAPSDEGVRQTMETLFGVPMSEGYGTTETGFIARNGVLLPGIEYRLLDRPELGFTAADRPLPRGELAVRTARSTARYLDAQAGVDLDFTADGFFRTGDLVELGPGRRVRIVGRSKLTFKLAGAELVSPEELERLYSRSEGVEQIWITAAPDAARVVAVVVPRRDEVDERELLDELLRVAGQAALRPHERVAGVVIARREGGASPWTVENQLLTPSFKLNRRALAERYREAIAGAIGGIGGAFSDPVLDAGVGADASSPAKALTMNDGAAAQNLRAIAAIVAGVLRRPRDEIDLERSFAEQGGDSLATLEFAMRIEEVFGGKERLDEAVQARSESIANRPLRELAVWLVPTRFAIGDGSSASVVPQKDLSLSGPFASSKNDAPPQCETTDELELANRDAVDLPEFEVGIPQATSRDVLLTGANGFLGVHLLARLSQTLPAGARVFAIVRAASDRAACERLRAAVSAAGLPETSLSPDPRDRSARVVGIAGRLDAPQFGLDAGRWEELAREVGMVLHVAASVTGASGYGALRATNVLGTRRALELATTRTLKAFHLVSSLNVSLLVAGPGRGIAAETTPIPERLSREQFAANTGYAITKWVAERMVQELARRCDPRGPRGPEGGRGGRFRAAISRPALLSWSRATGYANDHDWLTRLLSSCLTTRSIPGPPEAGVPGWILETETSARGLDLVPVDFAAEAIARLAELARATPALDAVDANGAIDSSGAVDWNGAPVFHVSNLAPGERGLVTLPRLLDLLVLADLEVQAERRLDTPLLQPLQVVTPAEWRSRVEATGAAALPILGQLRQSIPSLPRTPTARFRAVIEGVEGVGEGLSDSGIDAATLAAFVRAHAPRAR